MNYFVLKHFNNYNNMEVNNMVNVGNLNLTKGQSLDLTKRSTLKNVNLGLGWDVKKDATIKDFDLDLSLMVFRNGNFVGDANHLVYFNNLSLKGIKHCGDNRTGVGDGDDEVINLDLTGVDSAVTDLYVLANIYKENADPTVTFGSIENAYCRLVDKDTNNEICRYNLNTEYMFADALVVGKISKVGSGWEFKALGVEFSNCDLGALLNNVVNEVHNK